MSHVWVIEMLENSRGSRIRRGWLPMPCCDLTKREAEGRLNRYDNPYAKFRVRKYVAVEDKP